MKRISLGAVVLALALAMAFTACGISDEPMDAVPTAAPPPTPAPDEPPVEVLAPAPEAGAEAPVWGEQTFVRDFHAGDGALVMQVNYTLPMVQNTDTCPAGAAVNAWYQDEGYFRMSEAEEKYETAVTAYHISANTGTQFQPTIEEMTYEICYEDGTIISVRRELYVNSGGAYPMIYRLAEQFDATTGENLDFSDFFTSADTVRSRVADAIIGLYDVTPFSREEAEQAVQLEDFYLTEVGYTFWIQRGVLPGLAGPVEITLPYDQMEDVSIHE